MNNIRLFFRGKKSLALIALFLIYIALSPYALGEDPKKNPAADAKNNSKAEPNKNGKEINKNSKEVKKISETQKQFEQLFQLTDKKVEIKAELEKLKKGPETKEKTDRIEVLQNELNGLNRNFETLSTQMREEDIPKTEETQMYWMDELRELTMPLLQAIHEMSEKPRKIDKLKTKIQTINQQIIQYEGAKKHLDELMELSKNNASKEQQKSLKEFKEQMSILLAKYDPELLRLKLEEAKRNLVTIQTSEKSVLDVLTETIAKFFRERGRNLAVALTTFIFLWWFLLKIYHFMNYYPFFLNKLNPQLRKLIKTAANLFIFSICGFASLISLYLLDDWLLLSMSILILIAIAWTSRQLVPTFFKELRMIMNLGTVREGERMIWKGVPWLVKEIGFFVTLVNERLEGGIIRMPVSELIGQHSRPVVENEPWFPTQKNDYVILNDDTYGRIESQTMEMVTLYRLGSFKYYPTTEFIALTPLNLSSGYRLVTNFGLDYGVQSRICDELIKTFEQGLKFHLQDNMEKTPPEVTAVHVHFDSAGESSLNLIIIVGVDGKYADDYYPLKWKINNSLVKICNENNLVIPFNQLTISLSEDAKNFTAQQRMLNPEYPKELT